MTRLTDDELGELLRETFAGQEELIDKLPEATNRRNPLPAMLAAAAVLVVLAGVLYGIHRAGQPDQTPPVAATPATSTTTASSESGEILGAAIGTVLRGFEPAHAHWKGVQVIAGAVVVNAASRQPSLSPLPVGTLSNVVKRQILLSIKPTVMGVWYQPLPASSCNAGLSPLVTVGPIVDKGDHKEVRISFMRGCFGAYNATYRIEKIGGVWKVTGAVGPVAPGVECANRERTSASPPPGC
jgi:hypothetical protein